MSSKSKWFKHLTSKDQDSDEINITVCLRKDQFLDDSNSDKYNDNRVKILAPDWVNHGLNILSKHVPIGSQIKIVDQNSNVKLLTIDSEGLTLKTLMMMARNNPETLDGKVNWLLYSGLDRSVIMSIIDLARQCVIVGRDNTTHYGGFETNRIQHQSQVIVVDQAALQFRKEYNTGRLILIGQKLPKGVLDDFIFENVVREKKKSFEDCLKDDTKRYVRHGQVFFDTVAYKRFVAVDFLLTATAANQLAIHPINFKFLKYGTGIYAGKYKNAVENSISDGIALGLQLLFNNKDIIQKASKWLIGCIELPFFKEDPKIIEMARRYRMTCLFTRLDALYPTIKSMATATTNCSDDHSPTGEKMNMKSVDSAIACNLEMKANQFNPAINDHIQQNFIMFSVEFDEPSFETGQAELTVDGYFSYLSYFNFEAIRRMISLKLFGRPPKEKPKPVTKHESRPDFQITKQEESNQLVGDFAIRLKTDWDFYERLQLSVLADDQLFRAWNESAQALKLKLYAISHSKLNEWSSKDLDQLFRIGKYIYTLECNDDNENVTPRIYWRLNQELRLAFKRGRDGDESFDRFSLKYLASLLHNCPEETIKIDRSNQKNRKNYQHVYRGVSVEKNPIGQVGQFVTSNQFESYSKNINVALRFAGEGTIYVAIVDKVIVVGYDTMFVKEEEVIVKPGQTARIVLITRQLNQTSGNYIWFVYLDYTFNK